MDMWRLVGFMTVEVEPVRPASQDSRHELSIPAPLCGQRNAQSERQTNNDDYTRSRRVHDSPVFNTTAQTGMGARIAVAKS